ncbi:cilia- and flagella-associated protein 47-like isoform X1 [Lytechinus variegatus]|uniref:cilia- and flagella-associated protein 47-like isoform X1 n=1 Tax=Lytechinus variegatus TaxID=7654 RepID=UPI001BB0DE9E|nr:cilia- and flagella-associated protein 47-like isoform X1 [Lytechinus variegatus]
MDGDIAGVRIIPPVVEFLDAEANTVHCQTVTVQNISKCSRQIKFHGPSTNNFKLIVSNPGKPVAPGLEVTASVEYRSNEVGDYQDRLILLVDEDVIEVPLSAYAPQPVLELESPVDFGTVVRNSKVLSKEISLYNHGSLSGMFKIKYSGSEPFTIFPLQGIVKPKSVQTIKIEFVSKKSGKLNEEADVTLEAQDATTLKLKANVVDRCLELIDPRSGDNIQCVPFGSTYYGTDKTRLAYLYNNGPDPINFVTVLQEDALGTEAGTDLTKTTVATLATKGLDKVKANTCPVSTLVKTLPNQGQLRPYEKCPLYFRFSPRYDSSSQGWKGTSSPPPRQDFALYMNITVVGSSSGFGDGEKSDNCRENEVTTLEVAITGTALPVLLSLSPQTHLDFGECSQGEHIDTLCSLSNESTILPVSFVFQPVAQFSVVPSFGKLKPGEAQDIIFSFKPNQYGSFKKQQMIDVLGSLADESEGENGWIQPSNTIQASIHNLHVSLKGTCNAVFKKKEPKFNPGITPLVVGEVGQFIDVKVNEAEAYDPRAAMLGSTRTKGLHATKSAGHVRDSEALVAYPNDRARSVRPSYRREQYKTIFTKTDRHTYVDPDYAYDEEELADVMAHKNKYNDYLKENREKRVNKLKAKEFKELNNKTEIGIKPASGLRPPKLNADEVNEKPKPAPFEENGPYDMLSSKKLSERETTSVKQPSTGGLNAVPMTSQEKSDCKKILSPQQLYQVVIGPPTIDFKEVCLKSTSVKQMNIVNNLDQFVHVVVEIDCRELRQTSPLSQVVPPNCKAELPLIFESNNKGKFTRNVKYTINGHHREHVTVYADVVPVALALSTDVLKLTPTPGMPAEAGLRDVIRLENKRNYPAEFTWQPILGERGTAFSIRPATGTVEAFKDLECEVVFHPSYHAPEEGVFALQVHGGETKKLSCLADLGVTQVMFMERRVLFGQVPLHLTTTRTAVLHNSSINHAYFQVVDPNPVPGLNVSPIQGVVPVGGTTELKIHLTPSAVMKFDTRLEVAIRGWKTIDLRMGGTVEPPLVDIDMPSFQLGGVYCGSSLTVPFKIVNRVRTRAKVVFDLSRFRDFSLRFDADVMEESEDTMNPGVFKVTVGGEQKIDCELRFKPTEVASYDFVMPVSINQTEAPTPDGTPFPPTPAPSSKSIQHIIAPRPVIVAVSTPKRRIIATALRQPLQVSTTELSFTLPSGYLEMGLSGTVQQGQSIMLVNNSAKRLDWSLDLRSCGKAMEEGIFRFVRSNGVPFLTFEKGRQEVKEGLDPGEVYTMGCMFCPEEPGEFQAKIPIILDGATDRPYQYINLHGILKSPQLTFDPLAIVLTPVPLSTKVSADFTIRAAGFRKETVIDVELPEVEVDDGSKVSVLSVTFPDGQTIQPCSADEGHKEPYVLKCKVTFCSPKPVSFTMPIKFVDSVGSRFSIPVTATADNCLLVAYPFVAKHRTDFQIVTEQGHSLRAHKTASRDSLNQMGEAMIMPVESPSRPSTHTSTSTSSRFGATTSTYEETDSVTESTYRSTPRDGAVNRVNYSSSAPVYDDSRMGLASRSLGSAAFPNEDSEEGIFHSEVLMAVQRWITLHGWSGGPFPVSMPEGLRSGVSKGSAAEAARDKSSQSSPASNNQKRSYTKTIYDLMAHLSGRLVPGIPINQALPADPTERVLQLHWQHSTLLTFLRSQGAGVAGIKPEYLFEPQDYQRWMKLQEQVREKKKAMQEGKSTVAITIEEEPLDEPLFESVSKRAWTDLLLQTIKVLVLARITPRQFRTLPCPGHVSLPSINHDPLCSNIYSVGERILLSWLNHHYEHQRQKIWNNCDKAFLTLYNPPPGGVPPSRWVVNFDYDLLDGLVLAAVLAAHVPFLIKTHLQGMYTHPSTAEQCLHNALKVVTAFRFIGLDYDIQAIDITDPNPISLMLLCQHLYQRLPQYMPKTAVEFTTSLHSSVTRQVRLTNPSSKPLTYHAMVAGRDARDFNLPRGSQVQIQPKGKQDLPVIFTSRFLRPAEAVLVLVGRRVGAACGTTLVFNLRTTIDNITPTATIKCESPCFELQKVDVAIVNPFNEAGEFRIVLVEAKTPFPGSDSKQKGLLKNSKGTVKKVRSKTDHGQKKERTPTPPKVEEHSIDRDMFEQDTSDTLGSFFCPDQTIKLDGNGPGIVTVDFLPFYTGKRQCSVLFISESVGEFLYSMEATATLPLPSHLPFVPTKHSVRISSAAAAGSGRGLYGGDDRIIYWRCDSNSILNEELMVPITNSARERALVIAAQQRMTDTEIRRRQMTHTLACGSVTAAIAALGLSDDHVINANQSTVSFNTKQEKKDAEGTRFTVEVNSKFFEVQHHFFVPSPLSKKPKSAEDIVKNGHRVERSPAGLVGNSGVIIDDGVVPLPIRFAPKGAGHYPCRVVLRSPNDIRVYQIECTVNPEGTVAQIEFTAPVHQSVSQNIPVVNQTSVDWPLKISIDGVGFHGPPFLLAKAMQITYYPLMFRPTFESFITGKMMMLNTDDGTEHHFSLQGEGQKPLALDHVEVECEARQKIKRLIRVPNVTGRKMMYRVVSDLPIVTGAPTIVVLPSKEEEYTITVSPWKRGKFEGILSFIAGSTQNLRDEPDDSDISSDQAERDLRPYSGKSSISSIASSSQNTGGSKIRDETSGYRVWFSLAVKATPPPPERIIGITCAAQSASLMEVEIFNPTKDELTLDVSIEGEGLRGDPTVTLKPAQKKYYQLVFAPAIIGQTTGSLIFQNATIGEFWYSLNLTAETPAPTTLPHMECELGKWNRQFIPLSNPTEETLELTPSCSNQENFTLEVDQERKIVLAPHSTEEVPLQFMPSALGQSTHTAKITFKCEQLGDWVFIASGTGLTPTPLDPVSVSATLGSNTSLIIPFRNPTSENILVDIVLSDNTELAESAQGRLDRNRIKTESAFCLLLKRTASIPVGPKATLDIPITFAPDRMNLHEALCIVSIKRENGEHWDYLPMKDPDHPSARRDHDRREKSGGLRDIRWLYPINGIPESQPKVDRGAVISCQARSRIEERLEVSLTGAVPSSASSHQMVKTRAVTPKDQNRTIEEDGVVAGEGNTLASEFNYELLYPNDEAKVQLENAVSLQLIRKQREKLSGNMTLIFNVIFAPFKIMRHDVQLCIKATTGGVWRFPLGFISTEPTVDDLITIESVGLNKQAMVGFRLTSQARHPIGFQSYFVAESDVEFSVSPQTGELKPLGTPGTLITVGFTPKLYGKTYHAKLVVQTADMQWTYQLKGVTPEYTPPTGQSQKPIQGPHPSPIRRNKPKNFILDNLSLTTTAVSSPIKGAPVLMKTTNGI